jgi:hypothetical protein
VSAGAPGTWRHLRHGREEEAGGRHIAIVFVTGSLFRDRTVSRETDDPVTDPVPHPHPPPHWPLTLTNLLSVDKGLKGIKRYFQAQKSITGSYLIGQWWEHRTLYRIPSANAGRGNWLKHTLCWASILSANSGCFRLFQKLVTPMPNGNKYTVNPL